jgi:hypothetical protein
MIFVFQQPGRRDTSGRPFLLLILRVIMIGSGGKKKAG